MKIATLFSCLLLASACSPVLPIDNPFASDQTEATQGWSTHDPLRIYVLDVGQGDATLVIGPTGKTMLIDGGASGQGGDTVLPEMERLGLDHLDWVVATHYDADHIGGIAAVMKERDLIPLSGLLDRGDETDKATPTYLDYLNIVAPYRQEATPGQMLDLGAGASAEVVVVNGRYADGQSIHLNPNEENEGSIGLMIRYGAFSYFTAGDLPGGGNPGPYESKDMETTAGRIIGDINVLHVAHHGSASSTNERFLEETKPEAAVISVGKDNDYGHPTEEVLMRLQKAGAAIYRTDEMGTIEIQTDGSRYEVLPP